MKFDQAANKMPGFFDRLKASKPVRSHGEWIVDKVPNKGIYVFYEDGKPLYVGRSNNLRARINGHGASSGTQYGATFAFKLLKDKIGPDACKGKTRKQIQAEYPEEYRSQRGRVARMDVRVVGVPCQVEQAIFEIYSILQLGTTPKYNEFRTT